MPQAKSTERSSTPIQLINSTLRDGVQGVWSGRLSDKEILPIVRSMDQAGYEAIDLMAPVQFEVCVKHLKENPWHRARAISAAVRNTPLFSHLRSRSLTSFDLVPDSVFSLWVERIAANGFKRVMIFDALHDMENLRFSTAKARAAGLEVCIVIFYTVSPFHTTEFYARKAAEIAALGPDSICLRDPSGLLTTERVREVIPTIRAGIGDIPLYLKSHCNTGQAEDCYIEAASCGVNALFVSSEPLANGASVPSVGRVARRLAASGMPTGVDMSRVEDEEDYFTRLAKDTGRPLSREFVNVDKDQYEHQIPGNMVSFTNDQLRALGMEHLLPQVLEEFVQVRADMGYPVMVTPVSQLVCVQAVLNVVQGERYKSIPNEVRKYIQGFYGTPDAPVADALRDRVGPGREVAHVEDPVELLRRKNGGSLSDDDLLLMVLFRPEQLQGIAMDGGISVAGSAETKPAASGIVEMISAIATGGARTVELRHKNFSFSGSR